MKELTVITSVKAENGGVGQIFLDRVCSSFTNTKYIRFIPLGGLIPGILGKAVSKVVLRSRIIGAIEFIFDMVFTTPFLTIYLITMKKSCNLFVTMSSRTIYRAIALVSFLKKDASLVLIIWDMPSYIINLNTYRFKWINHLDHWFFDKAISNANGLVTMGNRMDQALLKRVPYLPSTIHVKGQVVKNLRQCRTRLPGESIRFIFAGSIYAKDTWNSFVRSMSEVDWEIDGSKIELHLVGAIPLSGVELPDQVTTYGPLAIQQVYEVLENCHIGYAPYSFKTNFKDTALTSFPGKISDYIAVGLPFFYHGPEESEVFDSIQRSGAGVSCDSIINSEIIYAVKKIIQNYKILNSQIPNFIKSELSVDEDGLNKLLR